jgi:hypothetical protein
MRKISNETLNSLGWFSLIVLTVCTVGMCGAMGVAVPSLIAAVSPDYIKIDEMGELEILSLSLNFAVPAGFVALIAAIVLCVRRALPPLPLVLVALGFVSAAFCSIMVWNALATHFPPPLNIWKDYIWW